MKVGIPVTPTREAASCCRFKLSSKRGSLHARSTVSPETPESFAILRRTAASPIFFPSLHLQFEGTV
jgi:hypothetical protein